jgi:hypothetical protein
MKLEGSKKMNLAFSAVSTGEKMVDNLRNYMFTATNEDKYSE